VVSFINMVVSFRVFKKASPNNKVTIYLGRRDFIDHVTESDPIDGVLLIDKEYLQGRQVFAQLVCSFRYGKEDEETMGLSFKKELTLADEQVFPPSKHMKSLGKTRLQERLVTKLGPNSFPFQLNFPRHCPTSVSLVPAPDETKVKKYLLSKNFIPPGVGETGSPCGVEYFIRAYVLNSDDTREDGSNRPNRKSIVSMMIRKIQYAPMKPGRQPCTMVRKDFMFSPGDMELEATLDQQLYHHGDTVSVNISIKNNSNKMVKKISAHVLQCIDVAMFAGGHCKARIAGVETTEGCPITPGTTLNKTLKLTPAMKSLRTKVGVAVDGNIREGDLNLASSTLLQDENSKDIFGMVISYTVKVKLFLGAIGGELSAELPFILMHPKPNMKKIMKADTMNDNTDYKVSLDEPPTYCEEYNNGKNKDV